MEGYFLNTCAQISSIEQQLQGDQCTITVHTITNEGESCIEDTLPFRFYIPLNIVGIERQAYTVTVNEVSATLEY